MYEPSYLDGCCSPYQYSKKQHSVVDLTSAWGLYRNILSKHRKAGTIVTQEQSNKPKLCNKEAISPLLGASKEEIPEVPILFSVNK